MTSALAAAAAALGVLAGFEALRAADPARALERIALVLAPARAAGRSGRVPAGTDRRRLALLAAAVLGAGGWLVAGPPAAVALAVSGPLVARLVLSWRRRRWRTRLAAGAPAAARSIADALAAGHGVLGALGVVAREGAVPRPARDVLAGLARDVDLGVPVPEALGRLRRRAGPGPWQALVAALLLQRAAGGDLARLLRDLADGVDAAARVRADARAASAQARLTARIVLALPALAAVLAELASPGALAGMVGEPLPRLLVAAALALQLLAVAVVRGIAADRDA